VALGSAPSAGVPFRSMAPRPRKTLLEPGHEAEWRRLNAEKSRVLTPAPDTPIGELLRRGQHLSAQAAGLLRAVERGDERTRS
jgi:mannose/cellobiose epimerase-like protein (N-acyl-D-glucosamine 2-epimerase family)